MTRRAELFQLGELYCHSRISQQTGPAQIDNCCTFFHMCGCEYINDSKVFIGNAFVDMLKFCLLRVSLKVSTESELKCGHEDSSKMQCFDISKTKKEKKTTTNK